MSVSTESISPPTAPISISTGPTNADLRLAVPADQAVPAELILPGGDDDPADLSLADADELKTYQAGFFAAGEAARDASEASSFHADASSYKADPSSFSVDSSSLTATTATQAPLPHLPLPPIPRRFSHSPRDRDIYCWGYYDHAFVGVLAKRGAGDRLYDEYMMGMLGSEQDVLGKHTSALGKHMSPPSDEVRAYRVGWLDAKYVTANPVQSKVRSSYWAGGFRRAHIDKFDAAYNYKHRND
ncbi:hypothetical protein BD626DRAFT_214370 [Schizophyllum amplum]|uniref:Uncharacterized protein n=1 Tax=Schizophyllum amplum TaxID=97359 RepID=A0A550CK40_9AGAR|nr:hypothetical protein BD626DRAFT_214370 [Auriculariopsis ampla]